MTMAKTMKKKSKSKAVKTTSTSSGKDMFKKQQISLQKQKKELEQQKKELLKQKKELDMVKLKLAKALKAEKAALERQKASFQKTMSKEQLRAQAQKQKIELALQRQREQIKMDHERHSIKFEEIETRLTQERKIHDEDRRELELERDWLNREKRAMEAAKEQAQRLAQIHAAQEGSDEHKPHRTVSMPKAWSKVTPKRVDSSRKNDYF